MGHRRSYVLYAAALAVSFLGFGSLMTGSQGAAPPARSPSALEKRVDAVARHAIRNLPIAGVSVAVLRSGRLESAAGYGLANLQNKVPSKATTIYRTGSVGKQFTAATLVRLAEQGKLSLDDPLGKHLPGFPRRLHEITIRQLLQHTAGLREINADPRWARNQGVGMKPGQAVRLAAQQPLEFQPGERFSYSNTGYLIAAAIIEKVTRRPAAGYMTGEVLRPLGLIDTSDCQQRRTARWAQGYDLQEDGGWSRAVRLGRPPAFVAPRPINLRLISGAGAFCSTPVDLVRWTHELHEGNVLSSASVAQMIEPAPLPGGEKAPYGLGTQIRNYGDRLALGHAGIIWGFNAVVAYFPQDELAVSMMLNTLLAEEPGKRLWVELLGAVFNEKPAEWKVPYDDRPVREG